jgi:hypothetical protein
MSARLHWPPHPHHRVFQVFNRLRRCVLAHTAEAAARAELAKHPGGAMHVCDEYWAREYGHQMRVVVDIVRGPRKAARA